MPRDARRPRWKRRPSSAVKRSSCTSRGAGRLRPHEFRMQHRIGAGLPGLERKATLNGFCVRTPAVDGVDDVHPPDASRRRISARSGASGAWASTAGKRDEDCRSPHPYPDRRKESAPPRGSFPATYRYWVQPGVLADGQPVPPAALVPGGCE